MTIPPKLRNYSDVVQRAQENGIDPHVAVAAEMYGISINDVTHEQRRAAKVWNHTWMHEL